MGPAASRAFGEEARLDCDGDRFRFKAAAGVLITSFASVPGSSWEAVRSACDGENDKMWKGGTVRWSWQLCARSVQGDCGCRESHGGTIAQPERLDRLSISTRCLRGRVARLEGLADDRSSSDA